MGSKKTKTTQTNKPIYSGQIEGAAGAQQAAYARQQPAINSFSDSLNGVSQDLLAQYKQGDPTIQAAQGYVQDTLGMTPGDNPYLNDIIAQTGDNTRRQLQTQLGTRGGVGGSSELDIIGRALAENESGLRYSDYNNLANRQAQAAGMAPGLAQGALIPLDAAIKTGSQGALFPLQASALNSASIGGLLGQYQDVKGTQKTSPGFMDYAGLGLQAAGLFSDRRLKTDIKRVGSTDEGTPVYTYRYQGEGPYHMGVMADEAPHARGADVDGFATICYERVA